MGALGVKSLDKPLDQDIAQVLFAQISVAPVAP